MNNSDKMALIDEGARNAAMRLRVVAEQGRSGDFSCPEMALAASAILALRAEVGRLNVDFRKHSEAAIELYSGIYAIIESTCGIGLPVWCSPLDAVKTLADRAAELTRERDAWSDEAVKMLRQRNVLLEWARVRAGFAHAHDVMIAAGLAAAPAGEGSVP
jgi:hypothetical protein